MRNLTIHTLVAVAVTGLGVVDMARAGNCGSKSAKLSSGSANIVETAASVGSFNTLIAAVKAAGLVDTLTGENQLTVFAPTDEAFAKLPEGTVEALLNDLPKLRSILKYHVVAGAVDAAAVSGLSSAKTLLGQSVDVSSCDGVRIGNATVTSADVRCANGIIHVIDTVLMPKDDIVDIATKAGSFKTLLTAVKAAGLSDTLRGEGPFTVFAPTDEAFAKLPDGTIEALLGDIPKLKSILTYHVVPAAVTAAEVVKLHEAKTVQGSSVRISTASGVKIDDATVVKTDIAAANGLIHVIDSVIIPAVGDDA